MRSDIEDWLVLSLAPRLSNNNLQRLLAEFGSANKVREVITSGFADISLSAACIKAVISPDNHQIETTLDWANDANHYLVTIDCDDYPTQLREIPDPPSVLYVKGNISYLSDVQIAIVGARRPTNQGLSNASLFATQLSEAGATITSGLALGIDAACHQAAIDLNNPTVAVTATGLDRVYPAKHRKLAHKIADIGAIVTEFPLGTTPLKPYFPRRNRIISGLSLGTLVVEATEHSGSLTTAKHATSQGRDVFAIPGSIHSPLAKGCHSLIKEGAKLTESADDILWELKDAITPFIAESKKINKKIDKNSLRPEQQQVLEFIEYDPITADEIVNNSGLTTETVCSMLLILEMEGLIIAEQGGYFVRSNTG